jgi:hypothetical protein
MLRPFVLILSVSAMVQPLAAQEDGSSVSLHAGPAYARLPDVEFEVVQSVAGQSLFSEVGPRDSRADFAVFISSRLWTESGGATLEAHATVGTGLTSPGSVLYAGASLGFARLFLSLGVATTVVRQGVDAAPDEVFRTGEDRTLFAELAREREWGWFAALSVGVFP